MFKFLCIPILLCVILAHAQDTVVPHTYHVVHYAVNIRVDMADSSIAADCAVQLTSADDTLAYIRFNLVGLTVDSVFVNGSAQPYSHDSNYLYLSLGTAQKTGSQCTVHTYYHGKPLKYPTETWGGVYFGDPMHTIGVGFVYPGISMTRYWLPCYDLPDEKGTSNINITLPVGNIAASNGVLLSTDTAAGYVTFHWQESHPIATYLMCIATGTYSIVSMTVPPVANIRQDSLPVRIYVLTADSAKAATFFSFIPGIVQWFESHYGEYPMDKVGYALDSLAGGMEHQSLINLGVQFIGDTASYRYLAAHELSHQWWGDMVTPHDFRDTWLNEGFACFSETVFYEWEQGETGFLAQLHTRMSDYLNYFANPSSQYYEGIFPLYDYPRTAPSTNYPATIYYKGASVMGMLRWLLGDSTFFAGMRFYGQQNKYGNVTTALFEQAMDSISHQNLSWFFNEWVYSAGWPKLKVSFHVADSLYVTIVQTQDTTKYPLFTMPVEIGIVDKDSLSTIQRITIAAVDSQAIGIAIPNGMLSVKFDPNTRLLSQNTVSAVTNIAGRQLSPAYPILIQSYPNPVGESYSANINIDPSVYSEGVERFGLYDILGRLVRDFSPLLTSHANVVNLDLKGIPAGVYYYLFETKQGVYTNALTITQ